MPLEAGWTIALAVSLATTILTAALGLPMVHLGITGLVSLTIAYLAVREYDELLASGASRNALGSSAARNIGLVWAWAAISIFVIYMFIFVNRWPEWWQFALGFFLIAATSLMLGTMLENDSEKGKEDESVLKMGRWLTVFQVAAVALALVIMLIEGKFPRSVEYGDWAAINIFFFGALAVIAISLSALRNKK